MNPTKKNIAKKFHGGGFPLLHFLCPHKGNEGWGAGAGIAPQFFYF